MSLKLLYESRLRFGTLFGIGQSFKHDGVPAFSFVSFGCEPSLPLANSADGLVLLTEERVRPCSKVLSLLPSRSKPLMRERRGIGLVLGMSDQALSLVELNFHGPCLLILLLLQMCCCCMTKLSALRIAGNK